MSRRKTVGICASDHPRHYLIVDVRRVVWSVVMATLPLEFLSSSTERAGKELRKVCRSPPFWLAVFLRIGLLRRTFLASRWALG